MINPEQFQDVVRRWAHARQGRFRFTWPLKGGWEGWVQVELMAYFFELDRTQDIRREQPIYRNQRERVDLLLNCDADGRDRIPVEIKAQSLENNDRFIQGVEEDMSWLKERRNQDYQHCRCIAMALCFDSDTADYLRRDLKVDDRRIFSEIYRTHEMSICTARLSHDNEWIHH